MSDQDDASEKSHEASPKKLEDARKKGEVAKSNDINVALSYFGVWGLLIAFGGGTVSSLGKSLQNSLRNAFDRAVDLQFSPMVFASVLFEAGWFVAVFAIVPGGLIVTALIAQRALLFTPSKLQPKLSRLSVLKNAKNKFGRAGLFEFAKSFVKLLIYSLCLTLLLRANFDTIIGTSAASERGAILVMSKLVESFLSLTVVIAASIAIVDYGWQSLEHQRKNRMTHKELRDEAKDSEGDPHLKQARRARAQEIAMNQMMAELPTADVIIVNPTHFAVALKWEGTKARAPICIAKGVDEIAFKIRELATAEGIAIHSDPPTARQLFASVEIGQEISPEHYAAVAVAIRFAETLRQGSRSS